MNISSITKTIMKVLIPVLFISLVGCDGGTKVISDTRIGQLIGGDTVNNLHYITDSHSGSTNSEGEFVYEPGESIQFYEGKILIGKTKAMDVIASVSLSR